jgi:hypothetical protein
MAGIIDALLPNINAILSVRDSVGAVIEPIYFVTRTWYQDSGFTTPATLPEGYARDNVVQMLPTPGMRNFSQDIRLKEGGAIKSGDIILKNVSKQSFKITDLDGTLLGSGAQLLYKIGTKIYQVINVTEKYVTWDIQVRELTNQTTY